MFFKSFLELEFISHIVFSGRTTGERVCETKKRDRYLEVDLLEAVVGGDFRESFFVDPRWLVSHSHLDSEQTEVAKFSRSEKEGEGIFMMLRFKQHQELETAKGRTVWSLIRVSHFRSFLS